MSYGMNPNLYWRRVVVPGIPHGDTANFEDIANYKELAQDYYEEAQQNLIDSLAQEKTVEELKKYRFDLYYMGIILLTFGNLDVLPNVVNNRVRFPDPRWTYICCIPDLIPLPYGLDIEMNPLEVVQWIQNHHDSLRWNEAEGQFNLTEWAQL